MYKKLRFYYFFFFNVTEELILSLTQKYRIKCLMNDQKLAQKLRQKNNGATDVRKNILFCTKNFVNSFYKLINRRIMFITMPRRFFFFFYALLLI